eukprot:1527427-Pleurochrysis_carterae.AAC.4
MKSSEIRRPALGSRRFADPPGPCFLARPGGSRSLQSADKGADVGAVRARSASFIWEIDATEGAKRVEYGQEA